MLLVKVSCKDGPRWRIETEFETEKGRRGVGRIRDP